MESIPRLKRLATSLAWRNWRGQARVNLLSGMVGLIVGLLACLLHWGIHLCARLLFLGPLGLPEGLDGTFLLSPLGVALILGVPALGGLAVGWIARYLCPEVAGGGTTEILVSYHHRRAKMEGKVVPFKWLASCLTIGSGGSGGAEGPVAHMGAATGSWLAQWMGLSEDERGLLFTAGIAGGIGAVFRAPFGGALFACEMYYSDPEMESEALVPSLLASVCAYFVFGLVFGYQALLPGDSQFNLSLVNFLALAWIALLCALSARLYVAWLDTCSNVFKAALPLPWRAGLGGLLNGALALAVLGLAGHALGWDARLFSMLGEGYPILTSAVAGTALPLLLLLVAAGKLLTSGFTVGSGGSGGVFAPSMVIGGCVGALAGTGMAGLGYSEGAPKAYVLAGMAAFFAAGTACPLASLVIITEVAQGWHLLPAMMWVVALGYLLRPRPGLFKAQVPGPADSPVHQAGLERAFLRSRRVGQLCRPGAVVTLAKGAAQGPALRRAARDGQRLVPVLDGQGRPDHALALDVVGGAAKASAAKRVRPAPLEASMGLEEALQRLQDSGWDELPVVDLAGAYVGIFGYRDMVPGKGGSPA